MTELFQMQCPDVPVVTGELGADQTIVGTWKHAKGAACGTIGFACQPYLPLGDGREGGDERSKCLTHALALTILLRLQVIVLECVSPALQGAFVRSEFQKLLDFTGYHMTHVELKLHEAWSARRHRVWWILSSSLVGPIPMSQRLPMTSLSAVEHIMPFIS